MPWCLIRRNEYPRKNFAAVAKHGFLLVPKELGGLGQTHMVVEVDPVLY